MGGCKRLVDKASKALSIFQQRRDTVKQYIAGEHRTIHTLREGLERGRCIQALCFDEFCMKTLSEIISQAHIYILCWRSDQKNLFTKCHGKMNWPGHTHTYIYMYCNCLYTILTHTHLYIYCNCDTILCQCFKPSENKKHSSVWSLCTPSPINRGIFIPRSLRRFIY